MDYFDTSEAKQRTEFAGYSFLPTENNYACTDTDVCGTEIAYNFKDTFFS